MTRFRGSNTWFGPEGITRLTALAVIAVLLGGTLAYRTINIAQQQRLDEAFEQQRLMHDFESAVGYSGMIHNFKNWLLRPDETVYRVQAEQQANEALSLLVRLEMASEGFEAELSSARETVEAYQAEMSTIAELSSEGLSAEEIDAKIRFDDSAAVVSLERLRVAVDSAVEAEVLAGEEQGNLLSIVSLLSITALVGLGGVHHHVRAKASLESTRHTNDMEAFTRIVAHDLKGPLNQISRLVEFIREDHADLGAEIVIEQHLTRIEDRVVRLNGRIQSVFDYLRAGTSDDPLSMIDLDLLVGDVVATLLPDSAVIRIEERLGTVLGRATELETIVGNLLSNAVKHHPDGAPTISLRIADVRGRQVLHIVDDGPGIPADQRDRIFDMYTSIDPETDSTSGVGLAMVRRIVNGWGGEISISDVMPHGADFAISLPMPQASA